MPLLVHIASEKNIGAIRRGGIQPGKQRDGIYAMPVLKNYLVSHQWLRELKSGGVRTLCAVHFRVPDGEPVLMGHYSKEQVRVSAAEAAGAIMHAADPLGMQIVVPRTIMPKEIHAIRSVPQVLGWRYFPGAHATKACGCPYCQWTGKIKSRKLRDEFE